MADNDILDHYEILEISPNANIDTIERVFRHLAQRFHPDHPATGNKDRFAQIVKSYNILRDPEKRASYDVQHQKDCKYKFKLKEEAYDFESFDYDDDIREKLLSVLYVKRKRNINNPGMGNLEIEQLIGCPSEHLEFHIWYMKEKGWIGRMEDGLLAITAEGVDQAAQQQAATKQTNLLLTDKRETIHL